jgi:hypothetical protein
MLPVIGSLIIILLFQSAAGVWTPQDLRRHNYSPHRPPLVNGTGPVLVSLKLEIVTFLDVSEFGQSFTVDLDYKLTWNDYRLSLPKTRAGLPLVLDLSWKDKLWIPDIYFKNALQSNLVHGTINPITYFSVSPNADVSLHSRMTVQLICDMELFAYPHDKQRCFLDSTSLASDPSELILQWDQFSIDETIYFPKFTIDSYSMPPNCTSPNIHKIGIQSCIRGIVNLSRKVSYYITRIYAPSFLITCTNIFGYWIPSSTANVRVALNLTPFLSLVTMHNIMNQEVRASYVLGIHVWMFVCMFFTFMGLVEFFMATYADHLKKERKEREKKQKEEQEQKEKQRLIENQEVKVNIDMNGNGFHKDLSIVQKSKRKSRAIWSLRMSNPIRRVIRRGRADDDKSAKKAKIENQKNKAKSEAAKKKKTSDANPVDVVARVFAPLTYFLFIVGYFVYFTKYAYFVKFFEDL